MSMSLQESATVLVTGAGGFVGSALCARLLAAGHTVVGVARGEYPKLSSLGVRMYRADLAQPNAGIPDFLAGVDCVFHVAAKVDMWGPREAFERANVLATEQLLRQSKAAGVQQFVFTSSPSVIANGADLQGVDETQPYPEHYDAWYPQTKAQAERLVLAAHDPASFRTVALRPHLIFGPGDTNLIPTILEKARAGRLKKIGAGINKVDFCFIEDCVSAHLVAWQALKATPEAGGQAYFISQGEPVGLWDFVNQILAAKGLPPISRSVPLKLALRLAALFEGVSRVLPGNWEPPLTRFLVQEMATDHWFDISRARKMLGYAPQYSMKQALALTCASLA